MEPKLQQSIDKAKQLIEEFKSLTKDDFWSLERGGKVVCWIIKHNGCLKIAREKDIKLKPDGYQFISEDPKNLVIGYSDERLPSGFELGEANPKNCKNDYPYAMALKRCQDRVILKISGLAEEGIYSEEEAEEFKEKHNRDKMGGGQRDHLDPVVEGDKMAEKDTEGILSVRS